MLTSVWTQRIIWLLNCVVFGMIIDRLSPTPLWAMVGFVALLPLGLWAIERVERFIRRSGMDVETTSLVRTVILALIFFAQCAVFAGLIV